MPLVVSQPKPARGCFPSPINILSDDILAYLFELETLDCPSPDIGLAFSLLVSSVSSRWRLIALRTPALWTNIRISNRSIGDGSNQEWIRLLTSRSGVLPLNVQCYVSFGGRERPITSYLDGISEHLLSRSKTIAFMSQDTDRALDENVVFLTSTRGVGHLFLPQLKRVHVGMLAVNVQSLQSFVRCCPALESLELHRILWTSSREEGEIPLAVFGGHLMVSPVRLESVRSLSLTRDSYPILNAVEVPRLERLSLSAIYLTRFPRSFHDPLTMKNLSKVQSLTLDLADCADAQATLQIICAMPSLTAVVASSTTFAEEDPIDTSGLIFPPLKHFELQEVLWPEHVLRALVAPTAGTPKKPGTLKTVTARLTDHSYSELQMRAIQDRLAWIELHVEVVILISGRGGIVGGEPAMGPQKRDSRRTKVMM